MYFLFSHNINFAASECMKLELYVGMYGTSVCLLQSEERAAHHFAEQVEALQLEAAEESRALHGRIATQAEQLAQLQAFQEAAEEQHRKQVVTVDTPCWYQSAVQTH